jgi:hypothetical protein
MTREESIAHFDSLPEPVLLPTSIILKSTVVKKIVTYSSFNVRWEHNNTIGSPFLQLDQTKDIGEPIEVKSESTNPLLYAPVLNNLLSKVIFHYHRKPTVKNYYRAKDMSKDISRYISDVQHKHSSPDQGILESGIVGEITCWILSTEEERLTALKLFNTELE